MNIVITDSGVGGLSVCAYAERFVRTHGCHEPVRLTFVNAAPRNDYGYNSMPSREAKLEAFDRFLATAVAGFAPDLVYVACNTLSVLLPDTPYARAARLPIKGILEAGVAPLVRELEASPDASAWIFATPTTIDAGAYPRLLEARGIAASSIVSQACPGLADTISEDRDGAATKAQIVKWVNAAHAQAPRARHVVACLACTHYGYRKQLWADVLAEAGLRATIVNPNEQAVDDIFGRQGGSHRDVEVELVTGYAIPDATVLALGYFLRDISPRTVSALERFILRPGVA